MSKEQFKAKYESIFADYPDIVNVAQLQKMLGISRHLAYQYLNDGTIQGVIIGHSYRVPKVNVVDFVLNINPTTEKTTKSDLN